MLSLILVTFVLAFAQCQNKEFSCFRDDGFYCTNDLAGYHDCTLMWVNPVNPPKYCPSGTRCSCFINTKCKVPESEICQPIQTPPKLPEDFDYTFTLRGNTTQGAWIQIFDQLKRVIRNTDLKMLRERTWNLKTLEQSFEVVLPIVGGKFGHVSSDYYWFFVFLSWNVKMILYFSQNITTRNTVFCLKSDKYYRIKYKIFYLIS